MHLRSTASTETATRKRSPRSRQHEWLSCFVGSQGDPSLREEIAAAASVTQMRPLGSVPTLAAAGATPQNVGVDFKPATVLDVKGR